MTSGARSTPRCCRSLVAVFALLLPAAGCTTSDSGPRATPAPPFKDPLTATPAQWKTYVSQLQFDSTGLTSDSVVGVKDGIRSVTRFVSERGVARVANDDIARGRIIGRAVTSGAPPYLDAPAGLSYVYVDSSATGWRWIWVADGRAWKPVHSMIRGPTDYVAKSTTGFRTLMDTFPNGRCGSRCCLALYSSYFGDPVKINLLFEEAHRVP